jgi:hypothetical protein
MSVTPRILTKRNASRLLAVWLLTTLAACGGAKKEEAPDPGHTKKAAAAPPPVEGTGTAVDGWVVLGENAKWKPIKPMFEAYAKRDVSGLHNPVRSNLVWFVEKPVPTTTIAEDDKIDKPKEKIEVTPFTRDKLSQMVLFMLVSGVAQPKAVLLDKEGNQLVVVRGDHLGSEGGVVKAITQYELQVSVPGEPDVIKSLKPPLNPVEEIDAETQGAGKKPEL